MLLLLLRVVVLDVVMQQAGLPEGLAAAGSRTLEGVVVQLNGEDGRGLVLDHSVHWEEWERTSLSLVLFFFPSAWWCFLAFKFLLSILVSAE